MARLESEGKTTVAVVVGQVVVGLLAVADPPKPESAATVTALRSMGLEVWLGPNTVAYLSNSINFREPMANTE